MQFLRTSATHGFVNIGSTSGTTTKVTLGWKPKYLFIAYKSSQTVIVPTSLNYYNEDISSSSFLGYSNGGDPLREYQLGMTVTYVFRIYSIDSDGFTLTFGTKANPIAEYLAVAE